MYNRYIFLKKIRLLKAKLYTKFIKKSFKKFGEKSIIFPPINITSPAQISIGKNVTMFEYSWINLVDEWNGEKFSPEIIFKDDVFLSYNIQISIAKSLLLGEKVAIGKGTLITDHIHDYTNPLIPIMENKITKIKEVIIEKFSVIGANCVIAPGVKIGQNSFIAANSVVKQDIPSYSIAAGNPAKTIKTYNFEKNCWESKINN